MTLFDLLSTREVPASALPRFVERVEDIGGVRVLRLRGNVGREIGREMEEPSDRDVGSRAFERALLLDFAHTTGADSSTVSYLVYGLRQRMRSNVGVGIINPSPELKAQLEIAKLDTILRCFGSEEEAIEVLAGV